MEFKDRIKQLRTEKRWSQTEFAEMLGVTQKQVSAYECGASLPSAEVLFHIAEILNVSLDYLVFEKLKSPTWAEVKDADLLRMFEEVDKFDEEKKTIVKKFIALMINEERIKGIIS